LINIGLEKIAEKKPSRNAKKIQSAWRRFGQNKYSPLIDKLEEIDPDPFVFPL